MMDGTALVAVFTSFIKEVRKTLSGLNQFLKALDAAGLSSNQWRYGYRMNARGYRGKIKRDCYGRQRRVAP